VGIAHDDLLNRAEPIDDQADLPVQGTGDLGQRPRGLRAQEAALGGPAPIQRLERLDLGGLEPGRVAVEDGNR